tara:strand:+ start:93 stop:758 length:666 start_codon:yes stop_codon:yes gene_type:complete
MLTEKTTIESGKISLGLLLEIHKGSWFFVSLIFNYFSKCELTSRMALISSFFGGYGLLWLLKSNTFHDKNFYLVHYSAPEALLMFSSICIYYIFPWKASQNCTEITYFDTLTGSICFVIGSFLHYSSDSQKFYTLKYNPKNLIKEGLFSIVQHPNYSGEILNWIGLAIISDKYSILCYLPLLYLLLITFCIGIPGKTKSLKKYDNYNDYNKGTKLLIPGVY